MELTQIYVQEVIKLVSGPWENKNEKMLIGKITTRAQQTVVIRSCRGM